jgi:hypothetical protein
VCAAQCADVCFFARARALLTGRCDAVGLRLPPHGSCLVHGFACGLGVRDRFGGLTPKLATLVYRDCSTRFHYFSSGFLLFPHCLRN